jgi:hypothetical protein
MTNEGIPSLPKPETGAVSAQLDRILDSKAFKSSPRCRQFLRYVVTQAASGHTELLRERLIGTELFGRDATYDKAEDSVVRVRANDVRRRITQYYAEEAGQNEVRIVLRPGSYVPEFLTPADEKPQTAEVHTAIPKPATWKAQAITAALTLAAAALVYLLLGQIHSGTALDAFWKPICQSKDPVLMVVSDAPVFSLKGSTVPRGLEDDPDVVVDVPKSAPQTFAASEVRALQGDYTGIGIASAALSSKTVLDKFSIGTIFRPAGRVTAEDLSVHPAVLIGGYANSWVLRFTKDLRFRFERRGNERRVRDRLHHEKNYILQSIGDQPIEDYPVLTRLLTTSTGKPMVIASAMTQWGCAASAEMASRTDLLSQALANAPGWQSRNLQILLRVRIIQKVASSPETLLVHTWQ